MINPVASVARLYGRRKGRPLRTRKSGLMETLLPRLLINVQEGEQTSFDKIFQKPVQVAALEIGFGGGEHLAAQAKAHPDICFIGCEPYLNGVASLLDHLDMDGTENVRILHNDARILLEALPDASVDKCFVLFADPWPKARHAERRFIGRENLVRLARVIKSGAMLRLASDHPTLVEWMLGQMAGCADFTCVYQSYDAPPDWIPTRYQEKAIEAGRKPFFMDYRRI